ncbi:alpha/beta fold hydrolase [Amycolatopsis vastitatis]|uniref:alpha/beta fold hydrolase n=1 Tax=Amycolatopsis vastitatis TaxID=1905142 RepID=UPI001F0AE1DE|nr:hypothetical protein [Amycolatopsis vastitatis]
MVVTGVLAPGVGRVVAGIEPKPALRAILRGGLGEKAALREDYLDELLQVGRRPGYPAVARGVYRNLPSLIAARSRYPEVKAPIHLVYGEQDWSRPSDRAANRQLLPDAEFTQVPGAGLSIDQPSTRFSSFGNPEITAVGEELRRQARGPVHRPRHRRARRTGTVTGRFGYRRGNERPRSCSSRRAGPRLATRVRLGRA